MFNYIKAFLLGGDAEESGMELIQIAIGVTIVAILLAVLWPIVQRASGAISNAGERIDSALTYPDPGAGGGDPG